MDFVPTHTINGTPVMKVKPSTGFPWFEDRDRQRVRYGRGAKPIPIGVLAEPLSTVSTAQDFPPGGGAATAVAPPPPRPAPTAQDVEPPSMPGDITLIHAEIAAAILRCAAWPVYGESCHFAESVGGSSAQLDGKTPEGDARVRVCEMGSHVPGGAKSYHVRVPRHMAFEVVE